MSTPLVSIVLVTRNGGATLPALLEAVWRQRVDFEYEVVAIDSGSTDGSIEVLHRSVTRLLTIAPESFNHGLTRNLAIEQARGDLVVLLVQDAVPVSDDWLMRLVAPLRADPAVAGAFCRQQPRSDASALARRYLQQWTGASPVARRQTLASTAEFEALDPRERLGRCAFDDVCSCLRRSVWIAFPFLETPIAEDLEWAKRVLLAGHAIEYVADAVVIHSHDRAARYELARTYLLHRRLAVLFDLRTIPSLRHLALALVATVRLHAACERQARREGTGARGRWAAFTLAVAWPLGQYLGGLSASRGWKPLRLRGV